MIVSAKCPNCKEVGKVDITMTKGDVNNLKQPIPIPCPKHGGSEAIGKTFTQ